VVLAGHRFGSGGLRSSHIKEDRSRLGRSRRIFLRQWGHDRIEALPQFTNQLRIASDHAQLDGSVEPRGQLVVRTNDRLRQFLVRLSGRDR
jgi:hypothetical protein